MGFNLKKAKEIIGNDVAVFWMRRDLRLKDNAAFVPWLIHQHQNGAEIVSGFIKEDLIDEYYLFINPVALGRGKAIFNAIQDKLSLKPVFLKSFNCGITVLCYHSLHQKQNEK